MITTDYVLQERKEFAQKSKPKRKIVKKNRRRSCYVCRCGNQMTTFKLECCVIVPNIHWYPLHHFVSHYLDRQRH